jgi:hypothetical protein
MQLATVLNLIRCEAERQQQIGKHLQFTQVDQVVARQMIENIAVLLNMVTTCPVEDLQVMSDFATRCQSHRFLKKHCGGCEEYDRVNQCPVGSGVPL